MIVIIFIRMLLPSQICNDHGCMLALSLSLVVLTPCYLLSLLFRLHRRKKCHEIEMQDINLVAIKMAIR